MRRRKIFDMNELRNGDYHMFDGLTGIARQGKFYVFFDYMTGVREGLGDLIGEGNTPELALIDAVKNMNKRMIKLAKKFDRALHDKKWEPYAAWYGKSDDKVWYLKDKNLIELDRYDD